MNTSLTVLLPVYNAQQRLADQVERLLDVLPEMSRQFEVVIVDDGSTDDTSDIAYALATYFPQVNLVRHPVRLGLEESIQTGLDASTGEVVFVGDQQYGIAVEDLQRLWQVHDNQDLMAGTAKKNRSSGANWMSKLLARSQQRQAEAAAPQPAVQMIRRGNLPNLPAATGPGIAITRRVDSSKANPPAGGKSPGPKYLNPIKRFALDEYGPGADARARDTAIRCPLLALRAPSHWPVNWPAVGPHAARRKRPRFFRESRRPLRRSACHRPSAR